MKLFFLLLLIPCLFFSMEASSLFSTEIQADKIWVEKSKRQLSLLKNNKVLKTYRISLGSHPEGPKMQRGDGKTPEGVYEIDYRNSNSHYHLSLHISYPNKRDITQAKALGVSPGGDIFIHGLPNGFSWMGAGQTLVDWTDGCIAVTNDEIEEIWRTVPLGTPIVIQP